MVTSQQFREWGIGVAGDESSFCIGLMWWSLIWRWGPKDPLAREDE